MKPIFKKLISTREEYFEYNALNYSLLKAFTTNPASVLNAHHTKSEALDNGSAIDTLLFDGVEVFNTQFYVFNASKPTAMTGQLAEAYCKEMIENGISETNETVALQLCKDLGLWSKQADHRNKLTPEFWAYIKAVKESNNRTVLSKEQYELVTNCVNTLKTHNRTFPYFSKSASDLEKIYQLAIVFEYNGHLLKGMLDEVILNHSRKTIIPIDLKSIEGLSHLFEGNLIKFRYDLQAEVYGKAIEAYRDKFYPDYTIQPFEYVVVSKTVIDTPCLFKFDPTSYMIRYNSFRMKPLKNLDEILDDFNFHSKCGDFTEPRELIENGFINLC